VRLQITLDEELVRAIDRRVGRHKRSAFIALATRRALENQHRWDLILSSLGTIKDRGHAWDRDVAAWVQSQRRGGGA